MIDYSKISNFEMNKMVAETLGFKHAGRGYIHDADGVYDVFVKDGRRSSLENYCGDWAFGGEIIESDKITIRPWNEFVWIASVFGGAYSHTDNHPLRAAMGAYLKMKAAEV